MATAYTKTRLGKTYELKWTGCATGTTAQTYEIQNREVMGMSVQISGTFGGATVVLQESNDGTNWFTMTNFTGSSISTTAAAMFKTWTPARYIRPSLSGGTGDSINVIVELRGED